MSSLSMNFPTNTGFHFKSSQNTITCCTCGELHDNAKTSQAGQEGKDGRGEGEDNWRPCLPKKNLKPFNVVKCKLVDETIRGEYGDLFPLGNKLIVGVKTPIR